MRHAVKDGDRVGKAVTQLRRIIEIEDIGEPELAAMKNSLKADIVCVMVDQWWRRFRIFGP
jgi:hypothetical protein